MAIVVKLTGDLSDLEAKLKTAGIKVEGFGDDAEGAGKKASSAFDSDLESSIKRIEEATSRAAEATETLASHAGGMNELAEGLGNTERVALGMNDVMGVAAEQFGLNVGPAQEYAQAIGDVAGGLEGVIGGGVALVQQIAPMVTGMVPLIASTWAHVTALYAQAAAFVVANAPMIAIIATIALVAAGVVLLIQHWDDITAKFPILGEATDAIKAKLDEFTAWITDTFVPAVLALYEGVKAPVEQAIAFVVDNWDTIRAVIEPAVTVLMTIVSTQFELMKNAIETAINVIKGIIEVVMGILTGDWQRSWDGIKAIVDAIWDGMKNAVQIAIDGIVTIAKEIGPKLLAGIGNLGELLVEAGKDVVRGLISGIESMASEATAAVTGLAGDMVSGAKDKLKIWSPSRVFAEIGEQIPAGLVEGIEEGSGDAYAGMATWINGLADKARSEWWMANADFAQEMANAGFFVNEDGSLSQSNYAAGVNNGVSGGFDQWLANNGVYRINGSVAPPPAAPEAAPEPPPASGTERGAGGLPTPSRPSLGGSGGTNGAGGNVPKVTPAGGAKADEELLAVLGEIRTILDNANRQRANVLDVLKQPQAIDFMRSGDPRALANLLAPFLADSLAQIYRRQWSPT